MIESKYQLTLANLTEALIALNVPYGGYSPRPVQGEETAHFIEDGIGFFVQLNFLPEATAEDRAQLVGVLSAFDFSEQRKVKPRAAIRQIVQSLTTQQRNQLLTEILVDLLESKPKYAKHLGIALDLEEVRQEEQGGGSK